MARTRRSTLAQVQSCASEAVTSASSASLVGRRALDHVLEQRTVGVAAHAALARLAGPHLEELLDDLGRGVLPLLPLIERLHRRQPCGLATAGPGRLGVAHDFFQRRPSATMARQA